MNIRLFSWLSAAVLLAVSAFSGRAADDRNIEREQTSALEGVLKVHQKYMFKYYVTGFGNGHACALFGEEKLKNIKPESLIRVEGRLGTRFHDGGSKNNPSPFPRTCYIYMDVNSVKVLEEPADPSNRISPKGPSGTAAVPDISGLRFVVLDVARDDEAIKGKERAVLHLGRFYGKIDQDSLDFRMKHETQELKLVIPANTAAMLQTNDIIGFQAYEHTKLDPESRAATHPAIPREK